MQKKQLQIFLFVALIFLVIVALVMLSQLGNRGGDVSVADTNYLYLKQVSPQPGTKLNTGDTVVVELRSVTSSTASPTNPSVAEARIGFDKAIMQGLDVVVPSDILFLGESVDNNNGLMSIDLAYQGQGGFVGDRQLAAFHFKVLNGNATTTNVSISPTTTFSYPNIYSPSTSQPTLAVVVTPQATGGLKMYFEQVSPVAGAPLKIGDTVVVALKAELPTPDPGTNPAVAEAKLSFDPAILQSVSTAVESDTLKIDTLKDNTNGKLQVDISHIGSGGFAGNRILVKFTFNVISQAATTTQISLDPTTTLGTTNVFDPAISDMVFALQLDPGVCGDNVLNGGEVCDDGNTANNDTCSSTCQNLCTTGFVWNGTACVQPVVVVCGDGVVNGSEVCDGGSQSCTVGGYSGSQTCNSSCTGYSSCQATQSCGDGVVNGNEVCDGGSRSCTSGGYSGSQSCNASCSGYATCNVTQSCGDGVVNGNEVCDGGNQCSPDCQTQCTGGKVWNGTSCGCATQSVTCSNGTVLNADPNTCAIAECPNAPVGCVADYNKNGTVDFDDFGVFGLNYKKQGIQCSLDITGNDCLLDIKDFEIFGRLYDDANACLGN